MEVNLCYGTFFTVVSAFSKDVVNNWQLHHRFMNVEYIPFGDEARRLPLTDDEVTEKYKQKQTESGNGYDGGNQNKFERIYDLANCKQTKTLPIQKGAGLEHRFIGGFLNSDARPKILRYVQTQIVAFLDENKSVDIVKAIIELLSLSTVPPTSEFFIDADLTTKNTKTEIADSRTRFNLANLVAGVLYYIVKNCADNTIGREAIEAWGKNPPNGSGISRTIVIVESEIVPDTKDEKRGSYIDNRGANIQKQVITNIDKLDTLNIH